jgi:hypothetical protein
MELPNRTAKVWYATTASGRVTADAPTESRKLALEVYAPQALRECPHNSFEGDRAAKIVVLRNYASWEGNTGSPCGPNGKRKPSDPLNSHRLDLQSWKQVAIEVAWIGEPAPAPYAPTDGYAQWQVQFGRGDHQLTSVRGRSLTDLCEESGGAFACVYMPIGQVFTLREFQAALQLSYDRASPVVMVSCRTILSETRVTLDDRMRRTLVPFRCNAAACRWAKGVLVDFAGVPARAVDIARGWATLTAPGDERLGLRSIYCLPCFELRRLVMLHPIEVEADDLTFPAALAKATVKQSRLIPFAALTQEAFESREKMAAEQLRAQAKARDAEHKEEEARKRKQKKKELDPRKL